MHLVLHRCLCQFSTCYFRSIKYIKFNKYSTLCSRINKTKYLEFSKEKKDFRKCSARILKRHFNKSSVLNFVENQSDDFFGVTDKSADKILEDEEHKKFLRNFYCIPGVGERVLLIQPKIRSAKLFQSNISVDLRLQEGVALAETLVNWKVVEKLSVNTKHPRKKLIFGGGNIEEIKLKIQCNPSITVLFINISTLSGLQRSELQNELGVKIYDRYMVVLQIFAEHARTKVSKLQIALAEIPYFWSYLEWLQEGGKEKSSRNLKYDTGKSGETYLEKRRRLLLERETKIKKLLEDVRRHRAVTNAKRIEKTYPVVAVVGYTNSGKTSLIKALTGDAKIMPKSQLFATLDVTAHGGYLKSNVFTVYIDTVGFVSSIPTTLIESFRSTLDDALNADLIIHVQDISHPDRKAQVQCVMETLKDLRIPESVFENIIHIANKVDLVSVNDAQIDEDILPVSCVTGLGIESLKEIVEEKLILITGLMKKRFRVSNGGEAFVWLQRECGIGNVVPDEDGEFLLIDVVISKSNFGKFLHRFGDLVVT